MGFVVSVAVGPAAGGWSARSWRGAPNRFSHHRSGRHRHRSGGSPPPGIIIIGPAIPPT